jgi:cytochrome oxidase Cu insertion factor (SCO1/SenC/PrrC family)
MQSIMKKFKVYARRVENPQNPDSYNVDHTSLVFLMNERSEFVDILNPGLP